MTYRILRRPRTRPVALMLAGLMLVSLMLAGATQARVLEVGPNSPYTQPRMAGEHAQPGDVIRIAPGTYQDCMVVTADRVTIEGAGPTTVLANTACRGKGILVISGRDVTVRTLVLRGARVADRNGAGIRAEGGNLTIESVQFIDNENGILTAANQATSVRIRDSVFQSNGKCEPVCAHGIYAGQIALLRIERSRFRETRVGHHIKSRASRTEIIDSEIIDGPDGTASYLIDIPNGGDLLVERTRLSKGPRAENPTGAIMIGMEGASTPSLFLRIIGNDFVNEMNRPTVFVVNRSRTPAILEGNRISGPARPLDGPGSVKER